MGHSRHICVRLNAISTEWDGLSYDRKNDCCYSSPLTIPSLIPSVFSYIDNYWLHIYSVASVT